LDDVYLCEPKLQTSAVTFQSIEHNCYLLLYDGRWSATAFCWQLNCIVLSAICY